MANPHKLEVGQKLWFVPESNYRTPGEVTIMKIGRTYANTDLRGRLNLETLREDGGQFSSDGRAYLSKEAWVAADGQKKIWRKIEQSMRHAWEPPKGVTTPDLIEVARLLKIDITEITNA